MVMKNQTKAARTEHGKQEFASMPKGVSLPIVVAHAVAKLKKAVRALQAISKDLLR